MIMLILMGALYGGVNQQMLVDPEVYKPQNTPPYIYAIEGVGGAVGGAVTTIGGTVLAYFPILAIVYSGWSDYDEASKVSARLAFVVGTAVGSIIGTACGASITGKLLNQKGSFWRSLAGSAIGTIVGVGIGAAGFSMWMNPPIGYAYTVIGLSCLCPIAGAVIGYNWK